MLLLESWSPPLHQKRVHLRQVLGELLPHSGEGGTTAAGSQPSDGREPRRGAVKPPAAACPEPVTLGGQGHHVGLGEPRTGDSAKQVLENLLWAQGWETQRCLRRRLPSRSIQPDLGDPRTGALHFFTSLLHKSALMSLTALDQLSLPSAPRRRSLTAGPAGLGSWAWRV